MPRHGSRRPSRSASNQERPRSTPRASSSGIPRTADLESYNKPELVELAASIGIEGRTNMTKGELVDAIAKASRTKR